VLNGFGSPEEVERIRMGLASEFGVSAVFDPANLSSSSQIREMISKHTDIDILVNNAGIQYVAPITEFPEEKWDEIISLNLSASFHTCKAVLPHMQRRGWGRIVNVASVHGLVASVHKCAYVAAKHGLVGLTKTLALETAETDITVNCINPGWVLTSLVKAQIEANAAQTGKTFEEAKAAILAQKQPSRQFVRPEELGEVVVFLCSSAAKQITGISLPVDGGWTAQ
jgi:3-hydroxybutyrate dehydrogenase